jgi:tRNA(Ile)-lysidine synthase
MSILARDEDAFWQDELARLIPTILLTGRPVRGGGRASGPESTLALDLVRLSALHPALQRRLLRSVAQRLGAALDFASTESLRTLALDGRAGQKLQFEGLHAERTHRELRLDLAAAATQPAATALPEYVVPIPGQIEAPLFDLRLRIELTEQVAESIDTLPTAGVLRNWRPGDRARLRYSSGPRKVKELLDRLKVTGSARALWPVLELDGRILWMKGVELEPEPGLRILGEPLDSGQ